jgi:hypothetical protein
VFVLFFFLVFLGYFQSRNRLVAGTRLALLPTAMAFLSLLGIWSSFGADLAAFSAWVIVSMAVITLSLRLAPQKDVNYKSDSRLFSIPGSWVPLILMMCIFFTKYAVAVARAIDPHSGRTLGFMAFICALYGLYSGLFMARTLRIARVAHWFPGNLVTDGDAAKQGHRIRSG